MLRRAYISAFSHEAEAQGVGDVRRRPQVRRWSGPTAGGHREAGIAAEGGGRILNVLPQRLGLSPRAGGRRWLQVRRTGAGRRAPTRHAPDSRRKAVPRALPEVSERARGRDEATIRPVVRLRSGSLRLVRADENGASRETVMSRENVTMRRRRVALLLAVLIVGALVPLSTDAQRAPIILATTTSTQDSGLLDVLVPLFEKQTGYSVKTIAVGTGQSLALAARGEADVTLCHAPSLEKKYVDEGKLHDRRLVMYNDFVIVGPEADPARIAGERSVVAALRRIAGAGARFVSRGDKSGTHALELALWKQAGVVPAAPWYIESGQGMGATLGLADDRRAYTLTDRATRLAFGKRVALRIVVEGDRALRNIYSVMEVNPANGPRVNTAGGKAFADFMVSPEVQQIIRTFGVDRYGQPLFVPIAGKREGDVTS